MNELIATQGLESDIIAIRIAFWLYMIPLASVFIKLLIQFTLDHDIGWKNTFAFYSRVCLTKMTKVDVGWTTYTLPFPIWNAGSDPRDNYEKDRGTNGQVMMLTMPIVYCGIVYAFLEHTGITTIVGTFFGVCLMIRVITLKVKKVMQDLRDHKADPKAHKE